MNANPMEEQIGRLVGNLLAGGGEIFLPGVGSLYTERQGPGGSTGEPYCRREPHGGLHLAAAGRVAGRRDCPRHA